VTSLIKAGFVGLLLSMSLVGPSAAQPCDPLSTYNRVAAFRHWRPLAEQGDATAQYNVGCMYANGWGAAQDYSDAVKWYRKAAEQGLDLAQSNLGRAYENGRGVAQDYSEAAKWFRKPCDEGLASLCTRM
jgi:uncharacterized protein